VRRGVKGFLLLTAPIQLSSLLQTEVRAQKYQASCVREMVELCGVVCERGYTDPDGRQAIRFADLFNSYRSPIFSVVKTKNSSG
jgi:hypothetical protein